MILNNVLVSILRRPDGNTGMPAAVRYTNIEAQYVPPRSDMVNALGADAMSELRLAEDVDIAVGDFVQLTAKTRGPSRTLPPFLAGIFGVEFVSPNTGNLQRTQVFFKTRVAR